MSTLRVNQVYFNDASNASISIANSWNVSIFSNGREVGQFRTNGDFVANNRIVYKGGGSSEISLNTVAELAFTQGNTANIRAVAAFAKANAALANATGTFAGTLTVTGNVVAGNITSSGTINASAILVNGNTVSTTTTPATNVQTFTANGTWTKPSGYGSTSRVYIQAWGGGGSGSRHSTGSSAGGGGGGGYNERWLSLSQLGATETVNVGPGGLSKTGSNLSGDPGGNTTFGSLITAYGGGGSTTAVNGGGGGGQLSNGLTNGTAGRPWFMVDMGSSEERQGQGSSGTNLIQKDCFVHGGGGGFGPTPGSSSVWGGGGGGGGSAGTGVVAGISSFGGSGGAGGATGAAGTQPGGGGGAGTTTSGAGAAGQVIVTVFYTT